MQAQSSLIDISEAKIYHFQQKKAEYIKADKWLVKECKQGQVILQNVEGTAEIHLKKEIIIITYQHVKAFFSKIQKGYVSIHIPIKNDTIELFQYKLQENNINLISWDQSKAELKKDIQRQCGQNIHQDSNVSISSLNKVGYQVGKLFGTINNFIKRTPAQKKSKELRQKVEELKEQKFSEESKQQQKDVRSKLSEINKAITQAMKPASDKMTLATAKLGNSFQQSDNFLVKGIRNFGYSLKNSLNQGYMAHRKQHKVQEQQQDPQKIIESQRSMK